MSARFWRGWRRSARSSRTARVTARRRRRRAPTRAASRRCALRCPTPSWRSPRLWCRRPRLAARPPTTARREKRGAPWARPRLDSRVRRSGTTSPSRRRGKRRRRGGTAARPPPPARWSPRDGGRVPRARRTAAAPRASGQPRRRRARMSREHARDMWRREPYVEENGFGFDVESAAPGRESSPNAGPNAGLGSPTRSSPKKTRDLATLEAVVARAETGAGPTPSSVSPARASFERARPPARASWAPGEASQRAFAYRPDVYSRGFGVSISGVLGDARLAQSGASAAAKTSRGPPGTGARDPDPDPEWEWQGSWQREWQTSLESPDGAESGDAAGEDARRREPGGASRLAASPVSVTRLDAPSPGSLGGVSEVSDSTPKGLAETIARARGRRGRRGLTGVDAQPEPRAVRRERGRVRGAAAVAGVALAALDVARSRRRLRELPGRRELPRAARCAQGVEGVRGRGRGRSREDGAGRARGHERRGVLLTRRVSFLLQTRRRETEKKLFFTSCAATNDQRQERKERTRFRRQRTSASFPAPGLPWRPRASTFRARIHRP